MFNRKLIKGLRRLSKRQTRLEKQFELLSAEVKERHLSMAKTIFQHNWRAELMFTPKGCEEIASDTTEEQSV